MFIGRENELKIIRDVLETQGNQNILIYGRRRVGKTELISEAIREKKAIYFEASEDISFNDVERLSVVIGEYFDIPLSFSNIREALTFLFKRACDEDLVFVIDEYPYLRNTIIGLDSIVQNIIDEYHKTSKLKFIICGSYADVMKGLLEYENPLYGRFQCVLDIKQMDYLEVSKFYSAYSDEDKVAIYSVFGGMPFYNSLVDDSLSIKENIVNLLLSPRSVLYKEVENYLKLEISKIANANAVFDAIASGAHKYSDILDRSHLPSSASLSDILNKLINMEVIRKEAPINDLNNRKKATYHISDNLVEFYYRYIYRYRSQLAVMDKHAFYDRYIAKDLYSNFIPKVFEMVCRQFLIRKNKNNELDDMFFLIGKYYYDDPKTNTNGEFDIVTEDDKGYIFYECKYSDKKVDDYIVFQEIEQVKKAGLSCYKYGFFSKSGYALTKTSLPIITYTISQLYSL